VDIPKRRILIIMAINTIQLRKKGNLTLPIELRKKYALSDGDIINLIDLGEGSILLTRSSTQVDRLGDQVARKIAESGVSVDEILTALDEERETYYNEHYVGK
jgi:bifunctional DNA-binding transcriptional regulator/antitoxin component of YhaV-PrlF toxin-antitoxin module